MPPRARAKAAAPAPAPAPEEPAPLDTLTAKQAGLVTSLPSQLAAIFAQSQNSLTTHRKLVNQLHKLFLSCCAITVAQPNKGGGAGDKVKLVGEKAFRDSMLEMLDKVVPLKKGVVQADRVVKFVAAYCGFATEHDPGKNDVGEATPTSRLLICLAKYLTSGFEAKNKVVRWRCVQLLAYVVESMAEMDNDLFVELRTKLLVRARDKESIIRQQAAIALMRFRPVNGDEGSESEDEETVGDVLLDLMCHDPSQDVRRAVMHNLAESPSPSIIPALLTRLRDVDPLTRRTLYRDLIASSSSAEPVLPPDPGAAYTLTQRHMILRGLKDREEGVRKEAGWLVASWVKSGCDDSPEALLSKIEVASETGRGISEAVVVALVNAGYFEEGLDESWWDEVLTAEKACLVRCLVEHFKSTEDEARLDSVLPVVTALAFRTEAAFSGMIELVEQLDAGEEEESEVDGGEGERPATRGQQELEKKAFVVAELLAVAMHADYGDEIGRRKMFALMRSMVSHPLLPHVLIPPCLDVLLKLSSSERDFMRVVVELVQELREATIGNDASLAGAAEDEEDEEVLEGLQADLDEAEATGGEGDRPGMPTRKKVVKDRGAIVLDPEKAPQHLQTLAIVRALLERVLGSIQDNTSLYGIVHELIIPAVRSKEPEIREEGLLCLGMCCFLDRGMALDSFRLLAHQSKEAEGEVQIKVLQILFDLFMLYGVNFLEPKGIPVEEVVTFMMEKLDDRVDVQATAAIGFSKLMLSGLLTDPEALKALVLVYFSPETADNQQLRQCLSYFFPAYCYSLPANQRRLQSVVLDALHVLEEVYEDQEDKKEMLAPSTIAAQMVDWTDPSKAVEIAGLRPDPEVHLDFAIDVLKELYKLKNKDQRKMLCQLLAKLNILEDVDDTKLRGLLILIKNLNENNPLPDTVCRNALSRFETSLNKRFGDRAALFDEAEMRETEGLRTFYKYIEDLDGASTNEQDDSADEDEEGADPEADYVAPAVTKKKQGTRPRANILSRAQGRDGTAEPSDARMEADSAPRRSGRARPESKVREQAAIQEEIDSLLASDSEEEGDDVVEESPSDSE